MKATITPIRSRKNNSRRGINKGKSGIYRWTNTHNGKSYVGSSYNLRIRIQSYFNTNVLNRQKNKSIISSAGGARSAPTFYPHVQVWGENLLKHGYGLFNLDILEYCEKADLIAREQHYIDTLKPDYNILKDARSRLGSSHTAETKAKIKAANLGIKKTRRVQNSNVFKLQTIHTSHYYRYLNKRYYNLSFNLRCCKILKNSCSYNQ